MLVEFCQDAPNNEHTEEQLCSQKKNYKRVKKPPYHNNWWFYSFTLSNKFKICKLMNTRTHSSKHTDFEVQFKRMLLSSVIIHGILLKCTFSFQYILSVDRANLNKELLAGKNITSYILYYTAKSVLKRCTFSRGK